jgi:HlyD family secretion protein
MASSKFKSFSAKVWIFAGFLTILVLVAAFGGWAYTTQISGAIITSGIVQGTSKTVIIQDTQGGKISEIHVTEGQNIEYDQKLLSFNSDELTTEFAIVRDQLSELLAKRARLEAEIDNSVEMDFNSLRRVVDVNMLRQLINAQETIFRSRREIIKKQVEQLDQRVVQISSLISGLEDQKNLLEEEIGLVKELLSDRETLLEKKLVQNSQVVELKRNLNQLQSKAASLRAEIAKNESSKNEVLLEVVKLTAQTQQDALTELRDQQFREMELKERYSRLKTKIKEREIRSPVRGEVFGLTFFNPGTVVRPAEKIMGIVPFGSTYVIEAKISPIDIDEVYVGQIVRVNFSSIERSDQVDLYTKIDTVSADAFTDERNGQTYFKAILSLPQAEINKLPNDFNVRPGMIAETYILKKDRNVITYLTDPLTGFFEKAFRE